MNIRNIIRNSGALIRIEGGDKKDRSEEENKPESSTTTTTTADLQAPTSHSDAEEGQGDGPVVHSTDQKVVLILKNL